MILKSVGEISTIISQMEFFRTFLRPPLFSKIQSLRNLYEFRLWHKVIEKRSQKYIKVYLINIVQYVYLVHIFAFLI